MTQFKLGITSEFPTILFTVWEKKYEELSQNKVRPPIFFVTFFKDAEL